MQELRRVAFICFIAAITSYGQEGANKSSNAGSAAPVKIYIADASGITPPELVPQKQQSSSANACKQKVKGTVPVNFIVDANGDPRNLFLPQATGTDLDKLALRVVQMDKFKPGTKDSSPVAVGQLAEIKLEICYIDEENGAGKKQQMLRLLSTPVQKLSALRNAPSEAVLASGVGSLLLVSDDITNVETIGRGVSEPKLIYPVEAAPTEEARQADYEGICVLNMIVDPRGSPREIRVLRSCGHGLDQKAIEAVSQYRFRPAMKNGRPVAVRISVEFRFRPYQKK